MAKLSSSSPTPRPTLSENESRLIEAVQSNSLDKVVNILNVVDDSESAPININCQDENGMSPLQHACFKGNLEIAKYLIERGANVNQNDHEHRYTCLMFAALGGHRTIIQLLLENGANIEQKNSVGRNASQMAAFVGQHQSVAVINNYISREFIEYYSRLNGQEKEPRLPIRFIPTMHSLVCLVAVNPVRIAYFFESNLSIFEEVKKIDIVMDHICEKLFRSNEPNEMLSLKIHYLNFIFNLLNNALQKAKSSTETELDSTAIRKVFHNIIKFWLKPNAKNFPENMERLLRQAIRSYTYQENALFQQLVRTLSTIEIGEEPSALSVLSQTILGKAIGIEENDTCFTCSEFNPNKRCSRCKKATYCDERCQRLHWPVHKRVCNEEEPVDNDHNITKLNSHKADDGGDDNEVEINDDKLLSETIVDNQNDQ
ncbi:Ankyrin repeat and MYND domain-containing protein 2 [Dermatophagoides pteronyssinus]|uniref:Ankyrin repeat and MYND domain-containing protein 2 n=1 Tax=Dermatophagoides pteronyssinus TaxID=6956 RepID=A0ABQ8JQ53_DERPT|nr:Ankyrin repeat and MYND domain-containing protein 2 [Dermatophagoides pteronyssinus]